MSDFSDAVAQAFGAQIARGAVRVVSDLHDPKHFGNAIVVLAAAGVQFRLVRDRGQVFADAADTAGEDDWAPLERVLAAVGAADPPPEGPTSPEAVAALVERHFDALAAGFAPEHRDERRRKLAGLGREREREMLERLGLR